MTRLTMLILMMLVSSIAFSQTNTASIITDSIVPLPKNVAREVVKDLLRKDSLESELTVCKENTGLLEHNLTLKDSVILSKDAQISLQKQKETNYETMLQLKDTQLENFKILIDKLNADIKKNRRKTVLKTIGNTVLIGGLGFILFSIAR
jgi:pantoate kinase